MNIVQTIHFIHFCHHDIPYFTTKRCLFKISHRLTVSGVLNFFLKESGRSCNSISSPFAQKHKSVMIMVCTKNRLSSSRGMEFHLNVKEYVCMYLYQISLGYLNFYSSYILLALVEGRMNSLRIDLLI